MKEMICIVCPRGCHLQINENHQVTGNSCKKGEEYAINELTNPKRMVTTTVKIKSEISKRLPVITSREVPKDKMFEVIEALRNIQVLPPIQVSDVILKNICDLNVDIIATRTILK